MEAAPIQELIALAEKVLRKDDEIDNLLDIAVEYTEKFSVWFDANRSAFEQPVSDEIRSQVEQLDLLHGRVLQLLDSWKTDTVKSLKAHQKKGKGMMAYLDVLPKKISVLKTHKG